MNPYRLASLVAVSVVLASCGSSSPPVRSFEDVSRYLSGVTGTEADEVGDLIRSIPDAEGMQGMRDNVILVDPYANQVYVANSTNRDVLAYGPFEPYVTFDSELQAIVAPQGPIVVPKDCNHNSGLFFRLSSKPGPSGIRGYMVVPPETNVRDSQNDTISYYMAKYKDSAHIYFGTKGSAGSQVDAGLQHTKAGWRPFMFVNKMPVNAERKLGWYMGKGKVTYKPGQKVFSHYEIIKSMHPKLASNDHAAYIIFYTEGIGLDGKVARQTFGYKTMPDKNGNWTDPYVKIKDFDPTLGSLTMKAMVTIAQDLTNLAAENLRMYPTGSYIQNSGFTDLKLLYNYNSIYYVPMMTRDWTMERDEKVCGFPGNGGVVVWSNRTIFDTSINVSINNR